MLNFVRFLNVNKAYSQLGSTLKREEDYKQGANLKSNKELSSSNLRPPICSDIHPAMFNIASILAAAIPWPLPLNRFCIEWEMMFTLLLSSSTYHAKGKKKKILLLTSIRAMLWETNCLNRCWSVNWTSCNKQFICSKTKSNEDKSQSVTSTETKLYMGHALQGSWIVSIVRPCFWFMKGI